MPTSCPPHTVRALCECVLALCLPRDRHAPASRHVVLRTATCRPLHIRWAGHCIAVRSRHRYATLCAVSASPCISIAQWMVSLRKSAVTAPGARARSASAATLRALWLMPATISVLMPSEKRARLLCVQCGRLGCASEVCVSTMARMSELAQRAELAGTECALAGRAGVQWASRTS